MLRRDCELWFARYRLRLYLLCTIVKYRKSGVFEHALTYATENSKSAPSVPYFCIDYCTKYFHWIIATYCCVCTERKYLLYIIAKPESLTLRKLVRSTTFHWHSMCSYTRMLVVFVEVRFHIRVNFWYMRRNFDIWQIGNAVSVLS